MAVGAVETGAEIRRYRVDGFVAVAAGDVRTEQFGGAEIEPSDAPVNLIDALQLKAFFRPVAEVAQAAAAAFRVCGTVRSDAVRGGGEAVLALAIDR